MFRFLIFWRDLTWSRALVDEDSSSNIRKHPVTSDFSCVQHWLKHDTLVGKRFHPLSSTLLNNVSKTLETQQQSMSCRRRPDQQRVSGSAWLRLLPPHWTTDVDRRCHVVLMVIFGTRVFRSDQGTELRCRGPVRIPKQKSLHYCATTVTSLRSAVNQDVS